jgi:hypothetical protein
VAAFTIVLRCVLAGRGYTAPNEKLNIACVGVGGTGAGYSGAVLLGNVAIGTGKKLDWDGPNMKVTNVPEANEYPHRPYRRGWALRWVTELPSALVAHKGADFLYSEVHEVFVRAFGLADFWGSSSERIYQGGVGRFADFGQI